MRPLWLTVPAMLLVVRPAFAQPLPAAPPEAGQLVKTPDTTSTVKPAPDAADVEKDEANTSYWSRGQARPFLSTAIDIGYIYLRPRLSLGYGKPFRTWVGIDINPVASNRFLGGYGGLRFAVPLVDLRVGARYIWAFQQHFLAPNDSYHRLDFENQDLGRSQYTSLEAELSGGVPLGPGSLLAVLSASIVTGAPSGAYVYDETLRVILKPPYVGRGRIGYAVRLGAEGKISLGIVGDVLTMPGRDEYVIRAGIVGSAALSDHVEVLGSLIPPIVSPDAIGIAGGDFAQLGIRYRWATGMPAPVPIAAPILP